MWAWPKLQKLERTLHKAALVELLISTASLDFTADNNFKSSHYEISYSGNRLQLLIFQDDICRMCTSLADAQAGNKMIEDSMESKLLDFASLLWAARVSQLRLMLISRNIHLHCVVTKWSRRLVTSTWGLSSLSWDWSLEPLYNLQLSRLYNFQ